MNYAAMGGLMPPQATALDWIRRGLNPALLSGAMTTAGGKQLDLSPGETLRDGTKAAPERPSFVAPQAAAPAPAAPMAPPPMPPQISPQSVQPQPFSPETLAAAMNGPAPAGEIGGANASDPLDFMTGIRKSLAENAALPAPAKKKILGMDREVFAAILGAIGDGLAVAGGREPTAGPMLWKMAMMKREQEFDREKFERDLEAKRSASLVPKVEQVGNTIGMFDPGNLSYNPIFTAPQPFELYAKSLGLEPGTPEYIEAIKEYRAGTWGDEGVLGRLTVQAPRLEQSNTNNIRSTSTSRANNIRSTSTSRENNIRSTGTSRDNNIRSNTTTRGSASYQGRGGKGGRGDLIGQVYQRGDKRIQYSKSKGGYVDLATGQRVD